MKKLLLKEIYRDEMLFLEMSMPELADSRYSILAMDEIEPGLETDSKRHKDIIKLLYEVEYKYNMIKKKGFGGSGLRKENILRLLEAIGKKAADLIGGAFSFVFEDWVKYHERNYPIEEIGEGIRTGEIPEKYYWEGELQKDDWEFDVEVYEAHKRVSSFTDEYLKNFKGLPFEKQLAVINLAKNITHSSGSMMDYYYENFGVDKKFFEKMSQQKTTRWDKELRELGVEI